MAASAFTVTLPAEGGHTTRNGVDALVVWALDATEAKAIAAAHYSGDSAWSGATATPVVATDFSGYTLHIEIEGTVVDVSVTGDATNNTIDELAALAVIALNATTPIAGAAYDSTTQVLKIAETTDALGDKAVRVELFAPGSALPVPGLTSTLVDQGAEADALTVTLPADAISPPKVFGAYKQVL